MYDHATTTLNARDLALNKARQELQGAYPSAPGTDEDISGDTNFAKALRRNLRYARASPVFLRVFGKSQVLRNLHDGGRAELLNKET